MTCRDEVLDAFEVLRRQHGRVDFSPGEIRAHVRSTGSNYADSTIQTHVVAHMLVDGTLIRSAPGRYRLARHRSEPMPIVEPPVVEAADRITEDQVKAAVQAWLESRGWSVVVRWGRERGIDIEARSADRRYVIEAKGEAPPGPQQVNYFLGALGELVQRLDDGATHYGLALPDNRQYRGLVDRLPAEARARVVHVVFFVDVEGVVRLDE